jgi:putative nucleotidyltransferase with HDIG domain
VTAPIFTSIVGYSVDRRISYYRELAHEAHLYRNLAAQDLMEMLDNLILAFANAIDAKSPWTQGHSERVANYADVLSRRLKLSEEQVEIVRTAALLHDIGKIGTYDTLLDKTGELTEEEYDLIKRHPDKGVQILAPINKLNPVLPVIRHHHERFDGRGYPAGLKGEDIPFLARVVCVADSYDAMTADRPYKAALSKDMAIEVLGKKSGSQFDGQVVGVFLDLLNEDPALGRSPNSDLGM